MTDKATPRPWRWWKTATGFETTGCGPVKTTYKSARLTPNAQEQMEAEAEANAALIVRCVNSHDALLAALTALEGVLAHVEDTTVWRIGSECTLCKTHRDTIRAAIERATGKELGDEI